MIYKNAPCVAYNWSIKRLDNQINKSIKVPKVVTLVP